MTITQDDLIVFLVNQAPKALRFHLVLAKQFVNMDTPIIMSEKQAAELLGLQPRRAAVLKKSAVEDGLWITVRGYRNRPSKYTLSPRVASLIIESKEQKGS